MECRQQAIILKAPSPLTSQGHSPSIYPLLLLHSICSSYSIFFINLPTCYSLIVQALYHFRMSSPICPYAKHYFSLQYLSSPLMPLYHFTLVYQQALTQLIIAWSWALGYHILLVFPLTSQTHLLHGLPCWLFLISLTLKIWTSQGSFLRHFLFFYLIYISVDLTQSPVLNSANMPATPKFMSIAQISSLNSRLINLTEYIPTQR